MSTDIFLNQERRARRSSKPRIQKRGDYWFLLDLRGHAIAHTRTLEALVAIMVLSWGIYVREGWV